MASKKKDTKAGKSEQSSMNAGDARGHIAYYAEMLPAAEEYLSLKFRRQRRIEDWFPN